MWGNVYDIAKQRAALLAEQAKKAAESIDHQLNESVGAPIPEGILSTDNNSETFEGTSAVNDDGFGGGWDNDDGFYDEDKGGGGAMEDLFLGGSHNDDVNDVDRKEDDVNGLAEYSVREANDSINIMEAEEASVVEPATFNATSEQTSIGVENDRISINEKGIDEVYEKVQELTLILSKPLGLILTEVRKEASFGVKIKGISPGKSADTEAVAQVSHLSSSEELVGMRIASVMGMDVTGLHFEEVMDVLRSVPATGIDIKLDRGGDAEEIVEEEGPSDEQIEQVPILNNEIMEQDVVCHEEEVLINDENDTNQWEEEEFEVVDDNNDDSEIMSQHNSDGSTEEVEAQNENDIPRSATNGHTGIPAKGEVDTELHVKTEVKAEVEQVIDNGDSNLQSIEQQDPISQNGEERIAPEPTPPKNEYQSLMKNDDNTNNHDSNMVQNLLETIQRQTNEISKLHGTLEQREEQLTQKSISLHELSDTHETELSQYQSKIRDVKEEARKRLTRAKEKVDELQSQLSQARSKSQNSGNIEEKNQIIEELRSEGEALAKKQGTMEQSVRAARAAVRELEVQLATTQDSKETLETTVANLTSKIQELQSNLTTAKKGEYSATKLESELSKTKEESEKLSTAKRLLDVEVKELKSSLKSQKKELEERQKVALEQQQEDTLRIQKERNGMLTDMEEKVNRSERESNLREDALRNEVGELRRRWQDAVRRADSLSMDVQQSTAPLLRQLQSSERQSRIRAAAWTELETKLRSDLDESLASNEELQKERYHHKTQFTKIEREMNGLRDRSTVAETQAREYQEETNRLEQQSSQLEEENEKLHSQQEYTGKMAMDQTNKLRNELLKSNMDVEERYKNELTRLEAELQTEKQKRVDMESHLDELVDRSELLDVMVSPRVQSRVIAKDDAQRTLGAGTNQESILQSTLNGLTDFGDEEDEDQLQELQHDTHDSERDGRVGSTGGSFAALEQLSLALKGAKQELEALRLHLSATEHERDVIQSEANNLRMSSDKLPLFETKIAELNQELLDKNLEMKGLHADMVDMKEWYRHQLDSLLEEKAATTPIVERIRKVESIDYEDDEEYFSTPSDVAAAEFGLVYDE